MFGLWKKRNADTRLTLMCTDRMCVLQRAGTRTGHLKVQMYFVDAGSNAWINSPSGTILPA